MPSYYWIKLYHEILEDPKMGCLSDRAWRRVIELFLLAGDLGKNGELPPLKDIAWRLRISEEVLEEDLAELVKAEIINYDENERTWTVINFAKRQGPVDDCERMSQFRERQRKAEYYNDYGKTECNDRSDGPVTNRNTDSDTDTNADTEEKAPTADAKTPKPKPKRTKKPTPEAVKVFQANAHRYPAKSWYADVAETVGEDPQDLERWGQVVKAYVGEGWNPTNVRGMLDFFERNEIPPGKGRQRGKSSHRTPTETVEIASGLGPPS